MATRKPNQERNYLDYQHLISKYNSSNVKNYSHLVDENGNFNLPSITLENIDEAVTLEFNKRFKVGGKELRIVDGNTESSSLQFVYPEMFNQDKEFLITPLFMYERLESKKIFRTNPSFKPIIYAIPKQKAQGVVIEEYITEGPISWELVYEFTFLTDFKESANEIEMQMNHYFRNKRNVIVYNNERFSIGQQSQGPVLEVEVGNKDNNSEKKLYVLTGRFIVWAYTRNMENVQKRERPNTYMIDISVRTESGSKIYEELKQSDRITIERQEIDIERKSRPK